MWQDFYLRFNDKAAHDQLADVMRDCAAVDEIGIIQRNDTGSTSAGYHVNIRVAAGEALPEPLLAHVIAAPALPKRSFMREV